MAWIPPNAILEGDKAGDDTNDDGDDPAHAASTSHGKSGAVLLSIVSDTIFCLR